MRVTVAQLAIVSAVGIVASAINTVAGGGSLLTFPALLGIGLSPLQANVTNTVGLISGQVGGGSGYRAELAGQWGRTLRLAVPIGLGALLGAVLLLAAPPGVFKVVVPWLIVVSCVALLLQPRLVHLVGEHTGERSVGVRIGLVVTGVYGGYFGAALGIMLLAVLAVFLEDTLQRLNAAKVVLSGLVNFLAALVFAVFGPVHWLVALVLAVASLIGGRLGAIAGRRIPAQALRVGVAVFGIAVATKLVVAP